ncbi:FAD binding domain-containing protein [Acetonema longum]|uniref:Molybdopterin dehydrogenase FAD-binding protein n=1 Tax=Acetonema longum DSM 6540 TaxID=1009370 RepID=F7NKJ8_9FIRM|nr:xanthine dehydrogenase family protein subunit M [Acetonema longum]EGO63450.1 molybdopterin dehydrogenase FAD-binding protein [Acetonema longum DSM 6540]
MLSRFDYVKPQTLEEALAYLAENAGTKILAGGTDLMVMLRRNAQMPEHILDIKSIPETRRLDYKPQEGLFIGASINVNEVAGAAMTREKYPALAQAANALASYQIRNRATLVGNICNASPGADLSGPLLVYDAKVHVANSQGQQTVAIHEFFTGVKKTVLQPVDIVIGVSLPDVDAADAVFLKQARIRGHDLGIVGVAARLTAAKEFRIAMSAVAPTPIRLTRMEEQLKDRPLTPELAAWAGEEAAKSIRPISDVRSSAEYRRHIAGVLVKRALSQLLAAGGI